MANNGPLMIIAFAFLVIVFGVLGILRKGGKVTVGLNAVLSLGTVLFAVYFIIASRDMTRGLDAERALLANIEIGKVIVGLLVAALFSGFAAWRGRRS